MNSRSTKNVYGLTLGELENIFTNLGEPGFRAQQVFQWMYKKGIHDFSHMTNLPQELRFKLAQEYIISPPAVSKEDQSSDGTKKYLYPIAAGVFVESAYIPEAQRKTLCISTQGGCKMACLFCMTARQGLQTHLQCGEIVGQYAVIPEKDTITNLVYMGMGEPLDNTEEVLKSIEVFSQGYGLSQRRITLSTIGIIPGMKRILEETQVNLAISLHSPFPEERKRLMPVQSVYPIESVIDVLKGYDFSQRKLSFEYIMFQGVNHSIQHARELVRLLNPLRCRVNLLHFHPIPNSPLKPCSANEMEEFQTFLREKGLIATIRKSRGEDIQAACGLLSTKELVKKETADPEEY